MRLYTTYQYNGISNYEIYLKESKKNNLDTTWKTLTTEEIKAVKKAALKELNREDGDIFFVATDWCITLTVIKYIIRNF